MTMPVAGWYDDPWSPYHYRYWDGNAWTPHAAPKSAPPGPGAPGFSPAGPAPYGTATPPGPGYAAGGPAWQPAFGPTTPDGVPLSGWWRRVGSLLLDRIIELVIAFPLAGYFWVQAGQEFGDELDRAMDASRAGNDPGSFDASQEFVVNTLVASLITLVVSVVYEAYFLRRRGATWGNQAFGIKVRPRDQDTQLAWPVISKRIGFMQGLSLLGAIPLVGILAGLAALLNYLWPLWDAKRQAWHDKVAGTNVVRVQR